MAAQPIVQVFDGKGDIAAKTRKVKTFLGNSRMFGVKFTKADGSIRTGSFRLGVKPKNPTGRGLGYDADAAGNIVAWDMNLGAYRTIPLRRVHHFRVRGWVVRVNLDA